MFGKAKKKMPIGNPVKNKQIVEAGFDAMGQCGPLGGSSCPCPHYKLYALDGESDNELYLYNVAGTFKTADKATFLADCSAAKNA